MKRKLLAVAPESINYLPNYEVSIAHSFEQAKDMIIVAENEGNPYCDLDLPVENERKFWDFIEWIETTNRKYGVSIFGYKNDVQFIEFAKIIRDKGLHFNS